MTQITWKESCGCVSVRLLGHADFARQGERDLVCAGISMLVCTLSACLETQEARGLVRLQHRKVAPGDVAFQIAILTRAEEVRAMLDTILTGFQLLQERYPENVAIEMKG